jgi:pyruvate carboxylase
MSGLTSQPNFNSIVAMLETHPRGSKVDLNSLNKFSNYWEVVREDYSPFESELKSGTAEVYEHEIPGGQYSNLLPQARSLGLENKFDQIKQNYQIVNRLLGDIVKVTPSSKVVGDVALFMTSNNLTEEDLVEKAAELSFPESLKSLFKGDLGQAYGGFPELFKSQVLKGEASYTCLPNEHLKSIDLEQGYIDFQSEFGSTRSFEEYLSYLLYPKVYRDYINQIKKYGQLSALPTRAFFYPLQIGQEIMVDIAEGKTLVIELRYIELAKANGFRSVHFRLNGQARTIEVRDQQAISKIVINRKAETANQIGAPLQGKLSQVLVKAGEQVKKDQALFVIEAMKMETIVSSPRDAIILDVLLKPGMLVQGEDLVLELK